jgi:DNA-binding MarR family transcriptional regulator
MTTPPAVYGQFGQALAFAERTMTGILHEHLAQRGVKPETWYALHLIATRGPGVSRQALSRDLDRSRNVEAASAHELLARLEAEGLVTGDAYVDLTAEGDVLHRSLREYVGGPTARLLSQFDIADIETTVRTVQAITKRAADEASDSRLAQSSPGTANR